MNLRNLFRVTAVLMGAGGLAFLLAARPMVAAYGVELDDYGVFIFQQVGALNISIGILCFLVSGQGQAQARRPVATFMVISQTLSLIVVVLAMIGGSIPVVGGIMSLVINAVLALAFAYFRFFKPEPALKPEVQT